MLYPPLSVVNEKAWWFEGDVRTLTYPVLNRGILVYILEAVDAQFHRVIALWWSAEGQHWALSNIHELLNIAVSLRIGVGSNDNLDVPGRLYIQSLIEGMHLRVRLSFKVQTQHAG
jgi:hypothetical protein